MFHNILSLIAENEAHYQRAPRSVSLLAVSKNQSVDKMRSLYNEGQRIFGENYLQEALSKMDQLIDCDIEWHFIGPIQSNKTKKIAEHFSWVQSVDSEKIAKRLNDQRPHSLPSLNICIEVNIDGAPTKSGVSKETVFSLIDYCMSLPHLSLRGLMAIPEPSVFFETQCESFHAIHELWLTCRDYVSDRTEKFDTLSMGMSADFQAAIKEGATMVRIGTAIFGERG